MPDYFLAASSDFLGVWRHSEVGKSSALGQGTAWHVTHRKNHNVSLSLSCLITAQTKEMKGVNELISEMLIGTLCCFQTQPCKSIRSIFCHLHTELN